MFEVGIDLNGWARESRWQSVMERAKINETGVEGSNLWAITPVNSGKSVRPRSPLIVSSYPGLFPQDIGDRLINFYDRTDVQ